jgi:hypothetical protein
LLDSFSAVFAAVQLFVDNSCGDSFNRSKAACMKTFVATKKQMKGGR